MPEYIDREAVYKKACRGCTRHGDEFGSCYHEEPCEELQSEFASAPIADVEPVMHAHWIKTFGSGGMLVGWKCSAPDCGVLSCYKGAYCPNCGAKMDEEERK